MSVPISKRAITKSDQGVLFVTAGKRLYVLEQGDPDRADSVDGTNQAEVDAFVAGETEIPIYADSDLSGAAENQPVESEPDGSYPYWWAGGAADLYCPDDPNQPITPVYTQGPVTEDMLAASLAAAIASRDSMWLPATDLWGGLFTATTLNLLYEGGPILPASNNAAHATFDLDSEKTEVPGKALKARLGVRIVVGATAPGQTLNLSLLPITAAAGGAGGPTVTLGVPIVAVSIVSAAMAAGTRAYYTSAEVDFPAPGLYAIGAQWAVAPAAGAAPNIKARIEAASPQ